MDTHEDLAAYNQKAALWADDLAHQLVRSFAAIDGALAGHYEEQSWAPPDQVAEQLTALLAKRLFDFTAAFGADAVSNLVMLLAEANDNLGHGLMLDPWTVSAFRAPVREAKS